MEILLNPVTIAVAIMVGICLLRFNLILAIIVSAIIAGVFLVGWDLNLTMTTFIRGMARHNNIALAYILLGALAYGIQASGVSRKFANMLERFFGTRKSIFLLVLAFVASFSQNLVPIHIAFIPLLVPPLLVLMNKLRIDRRAAACSLAFGLKAPYILVPMGFGLIFHNILSVNINSALDAMETLPAGIANITASDVVVHMWWPFFAMVAGLLIAVFVSYRKPRDYEDKPLLVAPEEDKEERWTIRHTGAALGAASAAVTQITIGFFFEGSPLWALSLGATIGLTIMWVFRAIPNLKKLDEAVVGGIKMMGFIAFLMLVAVGFGEILRDSGAIDALVRDALYLFGDQRLGVIIAMQIIGLLITMGIGTSFGTIPLIALVFVPVLIGMGFGMPAVILTIATAGATGDAGMPASDTALGPTAGLDADGQHDHLKDTCLPTFLHFNFPIKILGVIGAMILG